MQAFSHNIEDKTDNNEDQLYFIEQFTAGQPRELVRSCLHMNAATGFMEELYIEKAFNWATIWPGDVKILHRYALYSEVVIMLHNPFKTCQNVIYT